MPRGRIPSHYQAIPGLGKTVPGLPGFPFRESPAPERQPERPVPPTAGRGRHSEVPAAPEASTGVTARRQTYYCVSTSDGKYAVVVTRDHGLTESMVERGFATPREAAARSRVLNNEGGDLND